MIDDENVVRLTLAIARLGEADVFGWWRSRGLTEAGQFVLGGYLPRTWILNALEGDVLCAALRHDEALGRPTALHLFSNMFPAKSLTLAWLRKRKTEGGDNDIIAHLKSWTRENARHHLAQWVGSSPPTGESLGEGRRLGSVSTADLNDPGSIRELARQLAAAYVDQDERISFPYFDLLA